MQFDNPSTLYYYLFEPNLEVDLEDDQSFQQPKTDIARALCLCLMGSLALPRGQGWRNDAMRQLHVWETDFEYILVQISVEELHQTPPGSEYLPSSPLGSPTTENHRPCTRSQTGCAPQETTRRSGSTDSSDSDPSQAASARKRNFSEITSSPPTQRSSRQRSTRNDQRGQCQHHTAKFCTQRCLLGLQESGMLDDHCTEGIRDRILDPFLLELGYLLHARDYYLVKSIDR